VEQDPVALENTCNLDNVRDKINREKEKTISFSLIKNKDFSMGRIRVVSEINLMQFPG
jgi:hypothetical protein